MALTLETAIRAIVPDAPEQMRMEIARNLISDGRREPMPAEIERVADMVRANREAGGEPTDRMRFYWLPFPGMFQCVFSDENGKETAAGMGADKVAAWTAAEKNRANGGA